MKIAVLSGKGGAGKTMTAVNLAAAAGQAVYIDCDVEEPNGRLFLKPEPEETRPVSSLLPEFDAEKCTGCRKCVDFCRFHALIYIKEKPMVFSEVCHSCGLCSMVCPERAVTEVPRPIGHIEIGTHRKVKVITGELNPGEASGIAVIRQALACGANAPLQIIDCPPGSACSVQESLADADYCILVTEPTAFGFHNFQMVYELVTLMKKPCGILINKEEGPYAPLENFCREKNLRVLARIPFRKELGQLIARGKILSEESEEMALLFRSVLNKIGGGQP